MAFKYRPSWQYGVGEHSSDISPMLGSVVLNENSEYDTTINVRLMVLSRSSEWVFGRNITSKINIMQLKNMCTEIPGHGKEIIRLPIFEYGMNIYLAL